MKKYFLFAIAATTALTVTAQTQDPSQVDKPEPKVGNTWTYSVLDSLTKVQQRIVEQVVTEVTESQITQIDKTNSAPIIYDANWGLKQTGKRVYSPAIQALVFPMTVGKKWEHSNAYDHPSCGNSKTDLKSEVVGWEDVTVPAGTFRALRIDSNGYWRNNCGSDRLAYKFWYVPNVKWMVKSESSIYAGGRLYEGEIRELKAFHVE